MYTSYLNSSKPRGVNTDRLSAKTLHMIYTITCIYAFLAILTINKYCRNKQRHFISLRSISCLNLLLAENSVL